MRERREMKETGRIKLKEIPFSRTFETGEWRRAVQCYCRLCGNLTTKTPLGFPLFWNEFQDRRR